MAKPPRKRVNPSMRYEFLVTDPQNSALVSGLIGRYFSHFRYYPASITISISTYSLHPLINSIAASYLRNGLYTKVQLPTASSTCRNTYPLLKLA